MAIDAKITAAEVASYLNITVQAVYKRIKANGLKEKQAGSRIYFGHETARKIICPNVRQLKVALAVVKGGVGKTTLAEALAIRSALYGLRVLCIDVDQQANLTKGLGMDNLAKECPVMIDLVEKKMDPMESILSVMPGLDLVPSRLDNVTLDGFLMLQRMNPAHVFNRIFENIYKNYDLIIFDCPPTLGSIVCAAMLSADLVISPLNPDVYSYEGIEIMDKETENIFQQFDSRINWKILLNKFDNRTLLSTDYISQLLKDIKFSSRLLKSVIRTSQEFPNMKNKEKTIFDSLRKSTAKEDIDALTKEIIGMMQIQENNNLIKKHETLNAAQ
ncbi:MAG TPA: AAA family ATPase [Candidatus Aquirickettsiella sp.]|jgi:chromosome partitioning protein